MNDTQMRCTLNETLSATVAHFPSRPAVLFVEEEAMSYSQLDANVKAEALALIDKGIKKGDRVAIISNNSPQWVVIYFAILKMGAVVVPLLPDFTPSEVENILRHSGTKAIFIADNLKSRIEGHEEPFTGQIFNIDTIASSDKIDQNIPSEYTPSPDDLAAIIYTSGTTGRSKGVMLTHMNICSNIKMGKGLQDIDETDRFLSILPLSHTLENTVGMGIAIASGSSIHYLRKPPTASILMPALASVKPTIMLTVPLIMEKIFKAKVYPTLTKSPLMKRIYNTRGGQRFLHKIAGKKLYKTFGNSLKFYGVGGAKLDGKVEQFLLDSKFPYAIGYGLTETAPLLAGATPGKTLLGSTGPACENVVLKINDPNPEGQGEIWAKGPNVMKGYYKEPELTAEVITEDGWFRTGDLGAFDENGNLFIRGRSKSLILGSSGENIYPEDIESVINGFRHVVESLVVQQKGKLVALVHFNKEEIEDKYKHLKESVHDHVEHMMDELQKELQAYVNSRVSKFSRLQLVMVQHEPFQRTATQKIKRFLYQG